MTQEMEMVFFFFGDVRHLIDVDFCGMDVECNAQRNREYLCVVKTMHAVYAT